MALFTGERSQGFSNPLWAYFAQDYVVQWKDWGGNEFFIQNSLGQLLPNNGVISGGLENGGTAAWHLDKVPVAQ
jgi:hypothetical protein